MANDCRDVVIVGAGPVGLSLARLLAIRGHEISVIERWPEPYPLPRAIHFDDETGRVFQSMGLTDEITAITEVVDDDYEWRNRDGDLLVRMPGNGVGSSGWPISSEFSQPQLEQVLAESVESMPNVTIARGCEVVAIHETPAGIRVETSTGADVSARHLVGCDGADSFVGKWMGSPVHDRGFQDDWLVVDTVPLDDARFSPQSWQLCDPARPTAILSGGPGRRRWEFMRMPGEARESLDSESRVWSLLAPWGRTRVNTELERFTVYSFAARWADEWSRGRVAIAGDAAHQMPPFAGQGMCSGIRDAANLAWKLDRVLTGVSDHALLESYTSERIVHLQFAIDMSIALGEVICVLDEDDAAERDRRMIAGDADPHVVLPLSTAPVLGDGVLAAARANISLQGTVLPQFRALSPSGEPTLLDDITGYCSLLLVFGDADTQQFEMPDDLRLFAVTDHSDCTGSWRKWFDANGITAVLVRPDHYVFAAMSGNDEIAPIAAEYSEKLKVL